MWFSQLHKPEDKRKWQPTPVFLPGEYHGQRRLTSNSPWGHTESDVTRATWHTNEKTFFSPISLYPNQHLDSMLFLKLVYSTSLHLYFYDPTFLTLLPNARKIMKSLYKLLYDIYLPLYTHLKLLHSPSILWFHVSNALNLFSF